MGWPVISDLLVSVDAQVQYTSTDRDGGNPFSSTRRIESGSDMDFSVLL
jgi:hypothetical protein